MIEASPLAYPSSMLALGNATHSRGGELMRFYTKQHKFYCGLAWHARTMYLCVLNQEGDVLLHRDMKAAPGPFLKAIAPYREDVVVCVECIFTWYWLADLCAQEGMPFVLGHALSMKAIHGGKATNDRLAAHKIAVLLRGGMLPQASVYPAEMRATRARLRRRMHCMRTRAALLPHIHHTQSQYKLPEIGKTIAYKANREGVAERFRDPAVHKSIAVDLALLGHYDHLLRDMALSILNTAREHHAHTLYLLRTVPGIGASLSLGLLDELPDIARCPRVQDFVSYCRLVQCSKESAGKRYGTWGAKSGTASLKWAFSEAAVLFLRDNPAGQKSLARLQKKPGQGKALTVLAHTWARAVYDRLQRAVACDTPKFVHGSGRGAGEPRASLDDSRMRLRGVRCTGCGLAWLHADEPIGRDP